MHLQVGDLADADRFWHEIMELELATRYPGASFHAARTLIARRLKGLENVVSLSISDPFLTDRGWRFGGCRASEIK